MDTYKPWYADAKNDHPYTLHRTFKLKLPTGEHPRGLSPFPWNSDSLRTLWKGSMYSDDNQREWLKLMSEYWDAVAVGSNDKLHIIFTQSKKPTITFDILNVHKNVIDADRPRLNWTMKESVPFEPLVLFAYGSILQILNVAKRGFEGYQRAHGGAITSIAVHPTKLHLFATTSRDHSTRIYDLRLPADLSVPTDLDPPPSPSQDKGKRKEDPNPNPPWPPSTKPSLAGAAAGLRLAPGEMEGVGPSRCVAVLMGGRSGGHDAAVMHAAFHPDFPLIATCGMDRAVKIWPVRPDHPKRIKREDKPFFSTSRVHRARVLSIHWLTSDMLITSSATAINRRTPNDPNNKAIYLEPGELTMWTWLSLDRFFPAKFEEKGLETARPISRDWLDSSSFHIESTHAFPPQPDHIIAPALRVFQSPIHGPLITFVYPNAPYFTIFSPAHMKPRQVPEFPYPGLNKYPSPAEPDNPAAGGDSREGSRTPVQQRREDGDEEEDGDQAMDEDDDDEEGAERPPRRRVDKGKGKEIDPRERPAPPKVDPERDYDSEYVPHEFEEPEVISGPIRRRVEVKPPPIEGWCVNLPEHVGGGEDEEGKLIDVAVACGGRMIIGVGSLGRKGAVWAWRYDS